MTSIGNLIANPCI